MKTLTDRLESAKEGLDLSYFVNKRPAMNLQDGIAEVWVYGPLLQGAAPVERDLGATDYADLAAELQFEGLRGVLLRVDSPGGTVAGCIEVAELVASLPVPVVVHVSGLACSAAYKVACGADWLVSSPSATVGNVGTILIYADSSAMMAGLGVSLNAIVNDGATLKSTGHLDSLTEEQEAFLQEGINEAGAAFKAHVLAQRPGVDPEIWRAGWYAGERALALGLVDELGTVETARARLNELLTITL